jgi:3-oxoacyl-[acyl-carrier-protein] synthase-3
MTVPVGIVDLETYVPETFMPASEIAVLSGIPERVLHDKFGLLGKHLSAPDEHVSDMCIAAARPLLERNPDLDVNAVVYFGSHWKDYQVWQAAPKIQHTLGIDGFSIELINVSAGAPVALKVVKDMLSCDRHLDTVLMVAASKESYLLDYANERSRFMFNFGDGAVAALLQRGHTDNQVLGSSLYTDGSFADHVSVPAGGSVEPATHQSVEGARHYLDVIEGAEMKRRLDPIGVKNFLRVAGEAVERSGYEMEDVSLVLPIHMKRSMHETLLLELGVPAAGAIYLDRFGHMSAVDPLFALRLAQTRQSLHPGTLALLLAAGTGYSWAATVVRWGPTLSSGESPA